jgi:hypothetical protein
MEEIMLTTTNNCRLGEPTLDDAHSTTWRAINLELWIPYAFITHSTKQDFGSISSTTIFWIQKDVISFCKALMDNDSQHISNFWLLMPLESEDGESEWRWVQIGEVWSYRDSTFLEAIPVYVSTNNEIIAGMHSTVIMTDENSDLLYRSEKSTKPSKN